MNRAKRAGTAWEVAVRDVFREAGFQAERLPSEGAQDRGDIWITGVDMVIECKAERTIKLAGGIEEAKKEATSARRRWYACIFKRPGHHVREGYAVLPLWVLTELLIMYPRLDVAHNPQQQPQRD